MTLEVGSQPKIIESAAALMVGSELLSGKVRDENLYFLSGTLRALGIRLTRVIICPDDRPTIAQDIRSLLGAADVVFTSGGLGPTHDDVTVAGVCDALGLVPEHSAAMLAIIEGIYGAQTNHNHRLMATIPSGARLLDAGGWPLIVADRVWLLPGVPELFRSKLLAVRRELHGPSPIYSRSLRVSVEEVAIKDRLDTVVAAHPQVEVGSYPKWFDPTYKTLITVDGRVEAQVNAAFAQLNLLLAPELIPH